jgi:hypothetical protein
MLKILNELLEAAESNLVRYLASGDERAIRAGQGLVDDLRADIAALNGAA